MLHLLLYIYRISTVLCMFRVSIFALFIGNFPRRGKGMHLNVLARFPGYIKINRFFYRM